MFEVWYHDATEVDPRTSWTSLSRRLRGAVFDHYDNCVDQGVTRLFQYARPDAVIAYMKRPVLVIEQTTMNPSGHNLPQRFSHAVKAAENGVAAIYYYPEQGVRAVSDQNPRYLNVRLPLAQFRLMELFDVLSISEFWPLYGGRPVRGIQSHGGIAASVDEILDFVLVNGGRPPKGAEATTLPRVRHAMDEMDRAIAQFGLTRSYPRRAAVVAIAPGGLPYTQRGAGTPIDPPPKARLEDTVAYLQQLESAYRFSSRHWRAERNNTLARGSSLVFTGTANRARNDSEHPHPGHLTMLDILYCRGQAGIRKTDRVFNLIYVLPNVLMRDFFESMHNGSTGAHITVSTADLVVLDDAVFTGDASARPQQRMLRN
jgi:hypothetical protein